MGKISLVTLLFLSGSLLLNNHLPLYAKTISNTNKIKQVQPAKPKESNKFIYYKIDDITVATYDKENHIYAIKRVANEYAGNYMFFTRDKKFARFAHSLFGRYIVARIPQPNNQSVTILYDLAENKILSQYDNITQINFVINKNFHFFYAVASSFKRLIINKNGNIVAKTDIINYIDVSHLDGYTKIHLPKGIVAVFDFQNLDELVNVVNEIENKKLNSKEALETYFSSEPKYKFIGMENHSLYSIRNNNSLKIHLETNGFDSEEYEKVISFYDYFLVKKAGSYGVLNKELEVLVPIEYSSIFVENENTLKLCKGNTCLQHKLSEEITEQETIDETKEDEANPSETTMRVFLSSKNIMGKERYGVVSKTQVLLEPIYDEILYFRPDGTYKAKLFSLTKNRHIYYENGEFTSDTKLNFFEKFLAYIEKLSREFFLMFSR